MYKLQKTVLVFLILFTYFMLISVHMQICIVNTYIQVTTINNCIFHICVCVVSNIAYSLVGKNMSDLSTVANEITVLNSYSLFYIILPD